MQFPCFHNYIISFLGLKIKEAVNQPIYGRLHHFKYSQIPGCRNNWIIMDFVDDGTDEEDYEHIIGTIIDGNVMNMSLVVMEG